jgi:DNA polymerase
MNLITIDMETYYDREYSLSKMSTEEYVRHADFEVIGMGVKVNDEPTVWVDQPDVEAALKAVDWSNAMVLAQNTMFDGAILNWKYGVNPKAWADTLGMSRALFPHEKSHGLAAQAEREGIGAKGDAVVHAMGMRRRDFTAHAIAEYAAYCCNDVDLTHKLFKIYMDRGFPVRELKLIDLTLRMFIEPVLELDRDLLITHLQDVKDRKANLLASLRDKMIEEGNPDFVQTIFTEGTDGLKKLLMSNDKFATALESLGVIPPLKVSPTTGRTAFAFAKTDAGMLALQEHPDAQVQALVAARLGNKTTLEETRTERFIDMSFRGKFPVPLRYYGAHSGRWSGQDKINLQNLPSRGENAGKIKRAIKAPAGYVVIDCDSSQIEARTLAWLAGQEDLVQAFAEKKDVYKIMASHIYSKPVEAISKAERQVGKVVILGAGYGIGHVKLRAFLKLQAGVDVTEAQAKSIVDTYRGTYHCIPELWQRAQLALAYLQSQQEYEIDAQGICRTERIRKTLDGDEWGITLPSGLWIQYPGLATPYVDGKPQSMYVAKGIATKVYGGLVVENFTQAIARCVVGEQMLRIAKRYKVVLTVHDAVACIAPEEDKEEAQRYVEECMSWRPAWAPGLPLACESGMGASYGDC